MKRIKFLLFVGLLAFTTIGYGQEGSYFVKASGDTITCEITRITSDFLFYKLGETRSRVELTEVVYFHKPDGENEESKKESFPKENESDQQLLDSYQEVGTHERIRLITNVGIGYRTGRAAPSIPKDYMRQLRLGSDFDMRLQVFERNNGLGLEYNQFSSISEGSIPGFGYVIENITISYYGLSWIFRKMEENGNIGYASFGLGALFYENEGFTDGQELMMSGATIGLRINYDYSITINKFIAVGLNFGAILGTLTQIEINGNPYTVQNPEDAENISRINLGAGIRFGI
ncbi:MAG: hypothetical protein AB8B73_03720 [Ekhidna sp.]